MIKGVDRVVLDQQQLRALGRCDLGVLAARDLVNDERHQAGPVGEGFFYG